MCACVCKKKKWRFSNLKFDIKRERTKARHALTDEKRERERRRERIESLSLCACLSLSFSLSLCVCSCVIYKKRDVSIDDDQQRGGTRERRRRRNKSPETSHRARERMPPLVEPTPRDSLPRGHLPKRPGEISRREHRGGEESVDDWEDFERGDGKSSRSKEAFGDGCVYIIIRATRSFY